MSTQRNIYLHAKCIVVHMRRMRINRVWFSVRGIYRIVRDTALARQIE